MPATRIQGLDALRFLCALCVVQGHLRIGKLLLFDHLDQRQHLLRTLTVLFNMGFPVTTGPNAVVVFFVISGFCIHFPYRKDRELQVREFLIRRYIRVGIPAAIAAVLLYRSGFTTLQDSVLWSVICEMIYYTLYPLLIAVKRRIGWTALTGVAFAAAGLVILTQSGGVYNGNFTAFGVWYTWILGLPCWLMGCLLAEHHDRFHAQRWPVQWLLRLAIIAAASGGAALRFYSGIGYFWSQPVLSSLVYFWLGAEIAYFSVRRPWRWLEWCGAWSYSVYLFHAPIQGYVGSRVGLHFGVTVRTVAEFVSVLIGCFLLYCLIERPSHLLARRYRAVPREAPIRFATE